MSDDTWQEPSSQEPPNAADATALNNPNAADATALNNPNAADATALNNPNAADATALNNPNAADATALNNPNAADAAAPNNSGAGSAAAGIGLSRLSGVARAMLVTNILGVGAVGDAFAAALRIPNMLQNLLGEGALSAAFVPSYSKMLEQDRAAAGRLAASIASFLLAIVTTAVLVGVIAARPITRIIAWGFEGERFELAVKLVRITVIGSGVLVIGAWCVCVLNTHRRFFLSYVAPVIWNSTQIAALVLVVMLGWAAQDRATALAWAVTIGATAQVLFSLTVTWRSAPHIFGTGFFNTGAQQKPLTRHLPRHLRTHLSWRQPAVRAVLRRLAPAVAGRGAFQISAFADLALASLLAVGATAALAAAQALYLLPVALIGVAVAAAELPALSRMTSEDEIASRTAERLNSSTYLVCGIVAIYLAAGVPLTDTLFNLAGLRNAVGHDDVILIAAVLGTYSLGLPAIVASRLCQNVLFVAGNTRSPARIAIVRVSLSAGVGVTTMFLFDQLLVVNGSITGIASLFQNFLTSNPFSLLDGAVRLDSALPARLGAVGLALGASCGAWVELGLLRRAVLVRRRHLVPAPDSQQTPANRLIPDRLAHHIFPGLPALATGLFTAWLLGQVDGLAAIIRLVIIGGISGGVHLGLGLALRLPAARQLVSLPTAWLRSLRRGK